MSQALKTYTPLRAAPVTSEDLRKFTQDELDQLADSVNAIVDILSSGEEGSVPLLNPIDWIQFEQDTNGESITPPENTLVPGAGGSAAQGARRGLTWWDDSAVVRSLQCYSEDPTYVMNIGREVVYRCAQFGQGILKPGELVYVVGVANQLAVPLVAKAIASTVPDGQGFDTSAVLGVVTGTFEQAGSGAGYVMAFGTVSNVDLLDEANGATVTPGDTVYLSDTVAGGWQITEPATGVVVIVGIITSVPALPSTLGKFAISVVRPSRVEQLRDVTYELGAPGLLDTLNFDPDNSLWHPTNMAAIRACEFTSPGNGDAGNLTPSVAFNVASITAQASVGVYRVQLTTTQLYGLDLLNFIVAAITVSPGESGVLGFISKQAFLSTVNEVAGWFEFQVYYLETSGSGSNVAIETVGDWLTVDDVVSVMVHLSGTASENTRS